MSLQKDQNHLKNLHLILNHHLLDRVIVIHQVEVKVKHRKLPQRESTPMRRAQRKINQKRQKNKSSKIQVLKRIQLKAGRVPKSHLNQRVQCLLKVQDQVHHQVAVTQKVKLRRRLQRDSIANLQKARSLIGRIQRLKSRTKKSQNLIH